MDSNKDEAEKCIELAENYIKERNRSKAEKFLHKAERLYPTQKAKDLLQQINFLSPGKVETEQPRKRNVPSKEEEVKKEPEYTSEQEAAVKRIKTCKDYYEILNISKDATDSDIKKAYKKLALNLHPDKNKSPGAAEAFKSVGNAVAILTDPVKRKQYDLYGEEDRLSSTRTRQHQRYSTFEADTTPEEIFNMFFGGGFAESNVYVRRGGRWQRQNAASQNENHQHHQRESHPFNGFLQMLPILLAIVLSMASSFFISDPAYSLQASQKYPIRRMTQNLNIPYFVKNNFHSEYQGSVKRLELLVEEEYLTNLRHSCYREKNYKESMIWKAKNFGDRELFHTAQNIKTPSCEQLNSIRNHG